MGDEVLVEICDLDELVDKEEVLAAIAHAVESSVSRLVSLWRTYGNTQIAVVVIPALIARQLCAVGRIKVGLVNARIRQVELPSWCY